MALKTFNLDEEAYKEFSKYCKKEGISMSKKVENFIKGEMEILKSTTTFKKGSRSPNDEEKGFENKVAAERARREREENPDKHGFGKFC